MAGRSDWPQRLFCYGTALELLRPVAVLVHEHELLIIFYKMRVLGSDNVEIAPGAGENMAVVDLSWACAVRQQPDGSIQHAINDGERRRQRQLLLLIT
ncbi:hypothetical protein ACI65C_006636 [Semiaphis heraclei]